MEMLAAIFLGSEVHNVSINDISFYFSLVIPLLFFSSTLVVILLWRNNASLARRALTL